MMLQLRGGSQLPQLLLQPLVMLTQPTGSGFWLGPRLLPCCVGDRFWPAAAPTQGSPPDSVPHSRPAPPVLCVVCAPRIASALNPRVQVTNLEKRLALVEGREAAVVSQLRSAEAAAAEGESAAAENASLREQLRELKRDRGQLEHHKMVRGGGACGGRVAYEQQHVSVSARQHRHSARPLILSATILFVSPLAG